MKTRIVLHVVLAMLSGFLFFRMAAVINGHTNDALLLLMADSGVDIGGMMRVGFYLGMIAMAAAIAFGRCSYVLTTEYLNRKKAAD